MPRAGIDPPTFVRHFEDAARIINAEAELPALTDYADASDDMLAERQIRRRLASDDPAFTLRDDPRWRAIRSAHAAITPMFWGERIDLATACATIRGWIAATLERER